MEVLYDICGGVDVRKKNSVQSIDKNRVPN